MKTNHSRNRCFRRHIVQNTSKEDNGSLSISFADFIRKPVIDLSLDLIDFWSQNREVYPELRKIALKFLSIPATSVPSERILKKPDVCSVPTDLV